MRVAFCVSGFALGALLAGGSAFADTPLEAYAPLKVVGIMPDTRQALVWDEVAAEYRVVKAGDTLEGWSVMDISASARHVTVAQNDIRDELVLTRLPRPNALVTYGNAKAAPVVAAEVAAPPVSARPAALPTPVPPTATVAPGPNAPIGTDMLAAPAAAAAAAPMDPYGPATSAPVAEAQEPMDPYAASAEPVAAPPAAAPVTPTQPTVIQDDRDPELAVERHVVRRADLDREISDIDGLMATVQVAPLQRGGFALVRLDPGSWLAALGLRQGDRVRSIAGETVSTVDDAARVYARLRSASSFMVEVQRGQRRVILHYDVR